MSASRLYRRALIAHFFKVWLFGAFTVIPIGSLMQYLPSWLFVIIFFSYAIFVFIPVCFAIGPIGRRMGRALNEAAVAQAKAERDASGG